MRDWWRVTDDNSPALEFKRPDRDCFSTRRGLSSPSLEESYTAVIVSRPSDKNETSVVKIRGIFFKVRGLSRPREKNETSVVKIRGIF